MKILYLGSLCDDEWYTSEIVSKGIPSRIAQYSFEKALMNGFVENNDIEMSIAYLYQDEYYPTGKYLITRGKEKKINEKYFVRHLPIINLPILKEINSMIQGAVFTLKWGLKNFGQKDKVILTPFNYTPLSLGVLLIAKLLKIKRINIFTDLSSDIMNTKRQKNMHFIKKTILSKYIRIVSYVEHSFDGYINFTDSMNKKVNPKKKPNITIEGIFNNDLDLSEVPKERAVMYAGTLSYEYGVKNIIEAFRSIDDDKLELWLFGDGDMRSYIENLCEIDKRIKFFGFKSREKVFEYEKKASVLINARNPDDDYTKYSFPSKTFEYMVSGTPFITTKLDSIPREYYDHLITVDFNDKKSLNNIILETVNTPEKDLNLIGKKARIFILEQKNSHVQSDKIVNWINKSILNPVKP